MMIWVLLVFIVTGDGGLHGAIAMHAASERECKEKKEEMDARRGKDIFTICTAAMPIDGKIKG